MSPNFRKPLMIGAIVGLVHFLLCLAAFASVQFSADGQAAFVWFPFFVIDYPTGSLAFEFLGNSAPMATLIDWWYSIGNHQGPNIRAFILFGVLGSLHWFALAALIAAAIRKFMLLRRQSAIHG
jgi:hypothetical protein